MRQFLLYVVFGGIQRFHVCRHHFAQVAQTRKGYVGDGYVGTCSGSYQGCMVAYDTSAQHQHLRRFHTRHAAQQDAFPALRLFQKTRTFLHSHTPCYLTHGNQKGQFAALVRHRFVSQTDRLALLHRSCQLFVGSKMEISEKKLPFANQRIFRLDRLFHLDNHLGNFVNIFNGRKNLCACRFISLVGEAATLTRRMLHIHGMPSFRQLACTRRGQCHPVLIVLDFFWNSDNHFISIL
ncbi:hypothetical protein Barb6_03935 [Bacteroidales bacterium Barb6]|nr:hypothetical protein Barb6_03935 [Bacteroidales bacterium Barb6]